MVSRSWYLVRDIVEYEELGHNLFCKKGYFTFITVSETKGVLLWSFKIMLASFPLCTVSTPKIFVCGCGKPLKHDAHQCAD